MPALSEMTRIKREIDALAQIVQASLKPGAKAPMSQQARRTLRSDIEQCMQRLDELRTTLAG
jgi:hypothetical protein